MSDDRQVFHNPQTGETFVHWERPDGTRDLKFGPTGSDLPGHAVIDPNGNPRYLREVDRHVIADDRWPS